MTQDQLNSSLIKFSSAGHLDIVKYLVEKGADIHAPNDLAPPDRALRQAAHNGHLDVVKYLVDKGSDIHVRDDLALKGAARGGHLEVVKYLVGKGADTGAKNPDCLIGGALHWATMADQLDVVAYFKSLK